MEPLLQRRLNQRSIDEWLADTTQAALPAHQKYTLDDLFKGKIPEPALSEILNTTLTEQEARDRI